MSRKRQLAAIMFTDIEGYTQLMQQNENDAIALRNTHREIFETATRKFYGEVVQYFGDGTLSVFNSSVEAVECAIIMQRMFIAEQIPVRIGIHVGDIVYTNEDIIGDAVNVASRIESCATAGSILISDKVHDQIRSQTHIESKFLDAYELKNVEGAMPLFAIANKGLQIPDSEDIKGKLKELPKQKDAKISIKKSHLWVAGIIIAAIIGYIGFNITSFTVTRDGDKSIAVLPFDNLSTDPDSEIFRDGMTEDILTYLSQIGDLKVISRTSVMQYKDTEKSIPQIAKELGVSYILEGSIRKNGDKVRVTAQLIEAKSDDHIWADNYDKTITDIFEIQSEVSQEIVDALQLNLTNAEEESLAIIPTENVEAYKLFLTGRREADKRNSESLAKSIELYQKAIDLDPNFALAYAEIANSVYLETYHSARDPYEASETAGAYLDRAEAISDRVARVYSVRGLIYNIEGKTEEAKQAFLKAIQLAPNDPTARVQFSTFYYYNQQFDKQLEQAEIAYKLDPLSFAAANSYFTALVENYQYDEAEALMRTVENNGVENNPFVINRSYFRLYAAKKDYKSAIIPLRKIVHTAPVFNRFLAHYYGRTGDTINALKVIDTIRQTAPDYELDHMMAVAFAGLKNKDSVLHYLDTVRHKRSGMIRRERRDYFDFLDQDPDYHKVLESHGITPD